MSFQVLVTRPDKGNQGITVVGLKILQRQAKRPRRKYLDRRRVLRMRRRVLGRLLRRCHDGSRCNILHRQMPPPPRAQVFTDNGCATGIAPNLQRRTLCLGQSIVEILLPELRQMVSRARVVFQQEARNGFQILHARNCRGTLREAFR